MREFEEALKRARAGMSPAQGAGGQPAAPQPQVPTSPVTAPGGMVGAGGTGGLTMAKARPTATPAAPVALTSFPPLTANVAFFRENFGSHGGDSAVVDGSFRILRTRVLEAMRQRGGRVLGITSPAPGAGKTVTAIHLALACARRAEQAVILADFDFRRPAVAQYLDATGFKPSVDYFRGQGRAQDYLYRNEAGNLLYMLTDRATEMSAEHLASSRFTQALEELSGLAENALVICDLPPLTGCDDTLAVLPQLDGVLLVVAAGESRFNHLEEAVSLLPKEKIVGTVLNKAPTAPSAYDYY